MSHTIEGRLFETDRALINHVRWRVKKGYDTSFEDFYIKFYNSPMKCKFCNIRDQVFISIFRGWADRCNHTECKEESIKIGRQNSILKDGNIDFLDHFKENLQKYVDLYHVEDMNEFIVIPYRCRTVKRNKLMTVLSRYVPRSLMKEYKNIWPKQEKTCVSCDKKYFISILDIKKDKNNTCRSKKCIGWSCYNDVTMQEYTKNKEQKHKERLRSGDVVRLLFKGIDVDIVVNKGIGNFKRTVLCQDVFDSSGLTELEFYKECIGTCVICNAIPKLGTYLNFIKKKRIKSPNLFCSRSCYNKAKLGIYDFYPYTDERKMKQSNKLKSMIQEGTFTPKVTNSWCKSRTIVENRKFRSSWEAAFWLCNQDLLYEKRRISYTDISGKTRNYIVDFEDIENKILYEVKPDCNKTNDDVLRKEKAAIDFCKNSGYTYIMIGNSWFKDNIARILEKARLTNLNDTFYKRMQQFHDKSSKNTVD